MQKFTKNEVKLTGTEKTLLVIGIVCLVLYLGCLIVPKITEHYAYKESLTLARQGDWNGVMLKLNDYKWESDDSRNLYSIAAAEKSYADGDLVQTYYHLTDISDNYVGEFSGEVSKMKQDIQAADEEWKKKEEAEEAAAAKERERQITIEKEKQKSVEAERAKHIYIGDPESKIRKVFGEPDRVNRHVSEYGTLKQYVYEYDDGNTYIYTRNGVVTDFQD